MDVGTQQGTTLFFFTNFIYLMASYVLSITKPFRKEMYTNAYYIIVFVILWAYSIVIA